MENKSMFRKYYSRLAREGWLKALVAGLIVGFAAMFVAAFITWFLPIHGLWVSIAALAVCTIVATPIFYFARFRPTTKDIGRRVDRLGLQERIVTMQELENDDSYLAMLQREDAKQRLSEVQAKSIAIRLSRSALIAMAVLAVLGLSMTTVTALSAEGIIKGGNSLIEVIDPPEYIMVSYIVAEGGMIDGPTEQQLLPGEDAETVVAVADDGWVFVRWDDGIENPSRTDLNVMEDLTVEAVFQELKDGDRGQGEGDETEPSDEPADPDEENTDDRPGDQTSDEDKAAGKYEEGNNIRDGKTYYRDLIGEDASSYVEELLEHFDELPPELQEFVEGYFDTIV